MAIETVRVAEGTTSRRSYRDGRRAEVAQRWRSDGLREKQQNADLLSRLRVVGIRGQYRFESDSRRAPGGVYANRREPPNDSSTTFTSAAAIIS